MIRLFRRRSYGTAELVHARQVIDLDRVLNAEQDRELERLRQRDAVAEHTIAFYRQLAEASDKLRVEACEEAGQLRFRLINERQLTATLTRRIEGLEARIAALDPDRIKEPTR